jgi:hypothetical protein
MPDKLSFLPDEHHYAITSVVARAAQLDHSIMYAVMAQLVRQQELGKWLLLNVDINRLVNALHAALRDNFPTETEQMDSLVQRVKAARSERNDIMHWLWGASDDDTLFMQTMRPYKNEPPPKRKTAKDIYALAAELLNLTAALNAIDQRHFAKVNTELSQQRALLETLDRQILPARWALPETTDQPGGLGLLGLLPQPSQE